MSDNLPNFEDHPVHKAKLRITGAGDGLSEALALAPKAYHAGETMCLVLKAKVSQINHVAEKDTNALTRVHTAVVGSITEVEEAEIEGYLELAADRLREARDKASGQERLELEGSNGKPDKDLHAIGGRGKKTAADTAEVPA